MIWRSSAWAGWAAPSPPTRHARGLKVLGLEQFSIPNTRGSSHGATRILRLGLHEGPTYVPLVLRALELWRELGEHDSARQSSTAAADSTSVTPIRPSRVNSERSCAKFNIPHEVLEAKETRRRFPRHPSRTTG